MQVVETELYEILEVHYTASQEDIKKAYRNKAKNFHPDKGGDPQVFQKINGAYEILSNPEKREIYNKKGKNGLKESGISENVFQTMFGGVFNIFRNAIYKTPPLIFTRYVKLEELCTRKVLKLKVERKRLCDCIDENKTQSCLSCSGNGYISKIQQLGPGFIMENRMKCNSCQGTGKVYLSCENCKDGSITETKVFEVYLTPEFENGYKYLFRNEGNQFRGQEIGDFIVVLFYEKHSVFDIENKDLIYTHTISLKEALCGHTIIIKHPSGDILNIENKDITNFDTVKIEHGKGISENGNLKIKYKIQFPEKLSTEQLEILSKNL